MPDPRSSTPPPPPAPDAAPSSERSLPPPGEATAPDYGTEQQRALRSWIEQNEMVALLGGFALGVFIGVLMRR